YSGRERYECLAQGEQMLLDKAAVIPVSHSFAANLVDHEQLAGWYMNALDIHPFKYFRFRTAVSPDGLAMQ
ncbi:MAG: peptide ABC transporter substrate-binding protein, partial [Spirochaetia bacterium]|nr:peptide ABC transporter substrate-binding protein [Spirochaetia bacterium]